MASNTLRILPSFGWVRRVYTNFWWGQMWRRIRFCKMVKGRW